MGHRYKGITGGETANDWKTVLEHGKLDLTHTQELYKHLTVFKEYAFEHMVKLVMGS